jgi:membrane protein DedA with SNARE-associated domain
MIHAIITWLQHLSETVPPSSFVLIGGLVEELIAPIPSPLVATLAGSIAAAQNMGWTGVFILCALGTFTKTIGTIPFYYLGNKFEQIGIKRFGPYIGVSQKDIDRLKTFFTGKHRDNFLVILFRFIPAMPSTPITIICGMLSINLWTYFLATYIGFYFRNILFFYIGYTGISTLKDVTEGVGTAESILKVLLVLSVLALIGWFYYRRQKLLSTPPFSDDTQL